MSLSKDVFRNFGTLSEKPYNAIILCVEDPIKILKNVKGYPKGMVSSVLRDGSNDLQGII